MKMLAAVLALCTALPAIAQELAIGEVRKVDTDAGKITLKHGPIKSMDMPPMTMVFRVKDGALLRGVKRGDKVRFDVEKIGGQYVVVKLEPEN